MYTYESFVTDGTFTLMRPVFFTLLGLSIILFLLIVAPKTQHRLLNAFSVISLSLLSAIITVQVIYYDSIIVDEIGLGGDPVSTITSLITLSFNLLNPLVYLGLNRNTSTSNS